MAEDAARTPKPETPSEEKLSIPKPTISPLAACATTRQPGEGEAKVEKMLGPLPYFKLAAAGDFVKLHPSDDYWSIEYFFVRVPVPGQRDAMLHLVARDLARELPRGRVQCFRLALGAKPYDAQFFLATVPSTNLDNVWNSTNLAACQAARQTFVIVTSLMANGGEGYAWEKTISERNGEGCPWPGPTWPTETLVRIIEITFEGRIILYSDHPAWCRLVGKRQKLS